MKTSRFLWILCAGGCAAASPGPVRAAEDGASLPELAGARVTIPYTEMKSLWQAAQPRVEENANEAEERAPVDAVVHSAEYELILKDEKAVIEATYRVESLADGWQMIPLLGGDARLEKAEAGGAGILRKDESYCLLAKGKGDFDVKLTFAVPRLGEWLQGLRLVPGTATLNRLRVTGIPEGKAVRIPGIAPTEAAGGAATYHLFAESREILVSLEQYEAPAPSVALEAPLPSTWDIQSEVFARYKEGRIFYENRIYCQADDGSGMSMELQLPPNVLAVSISGDDLVEGRLGRRENGLRPLQVKWKTRDVLDRTVQLSYEVPQSPLAKGWTLNAPRVAGEGETRSLFAVLAVDGLELGGEGLKDSVQSRRLPEWLRERIGQNDFLTAEAGAEYPLETHWLPRVETAQAMVSKATYATRLVEDGALLVHAEFTIQHQSPLSWRLEMPAMDEILTCEVNQSAMQPVKRGDGQIEFAFATPENGVTTVKFCYAARLEALDPVSGRIALELPRTDLFTHELEWLLEIPKAYRAMVDGNVTFADDGDDAGRLENVIHLKKELVRGEHPAVEVHYEKRGLDE